MAITQNNVIRKWKEKQFLRMNAGKLMLTLYHTIQSNTTPYTAIERRKIMNIEQRKDIINSLVLLTGPEMDAVEILIKQMLDTRGTSKHDQIVYCKRERKFV